MATHSHFVDGKKTIADQQDTLNFMEQFAAAKVITYGESPQSTADLKVNEAVLMPVPLGQQPPAIELIAVPAGGDVAAIIAAQIAAGKTVVFHEKCWVENKETVVVGVRKT
jgi:hypothetical protein